MATGTSLLWSVLPILLKLANNQFSAVFVVWWRFLVAVLCTAVFLRMTGKNPARILRRPPKLAILAGLALAGNYYGFNLGIALSGATTSAILIQSGGLSLTLIGVLWFKERLTLFQTLGFLIATGGLCIFFIDRAGQSFDLSLFRWGSVLLIGAGVSWAVYASLVKGNRGTYSSHELNLLVFVLGMLLFLPLLGREDFRNLTLGSTALMIALGLNTFLAYSGLAEALRTISAAQTSIIISANPLLTLAIMHLLAGSGSTILVPERVTWFGYLGALATVAGVICVLATRPKAAKIAVQGATPG